MARKSSPIRHRGSYLIYCGILPSGHGGSNVSSQPACGIFMTAVHRRGDFGNMGAANPPSFGLLHFRHTKMQKNISQCVCPFSVN